MAEPRGELSGAVRLFESISMEPLGFARASPGSHLRLNGMMNVGVQEFAVTRQPGTVTFDFSSALSTGKVVPCTAPEMNQGPAESQDAFMYNCGNGSPDFIKVYVEDGETDVHTGMSRLLAQRLPVLRAFIHGSSRWLECMVALVSAGYTLLDLYGMRACLDAARDLVALPPGAVDEALRWRARDRQGSSSGAVASA